LLRLLRELAEDRPAELKDFAATLRSLCRELLTDGALDPNRLGADEMRQTIKDLLERAGRASDQMHAVESLILQHEAAQRTSGSARETLDRFLIEFHAGQHMVCYDALQEAGLLPRLASARNVAQEALNDPFTKQRLAEGLAAHLKLDAVDAYAEAERWLAKLERLLAAIPKKQRLIDGRMADFSRLSDARYRYQTEMRGRKPEQVKAFMDAAAARHAGQSFAELADEPGMRFLSPKVEVLWGRDALSRSRSQRPAVNLAVDELKGSTDPESAQNEIRRRNLNVLTPQRAARLVERLLPEKGARISTESLRLHIEDDLLDLLAVLAFNRGPSTGGAHRTVRWRVHPVREDFGCYPDRIPRDAEAGHLVERFSLERTH
jgi:cell division septum initiation protein DivIVA